MSRGKKPLKTHFSLLDIFLINLITKIQRIYKIKSVYIIFLKNISFINKQKGKDEKISFHPIMKL